MSERRRAERQKAVIADLGRRALACSDVVVLIGEAMRMIREILATTSCFTTRRLPGGEVRMVAVDGAAVSYTVAGASSQTAYTLQLAQPVR